MIFPISGVEISPLIPPLIAFLIAAISSTAGITGAFLLLPVQMSLFGFTSPAVTATNHLYNVFAGIGGPIRFKKEGRLLKPLFLYLIVGTVPGIISGVYIRIHILPNPLYFKMFAGCVMMLLGFLILLRNRRPVSENKSLANSGNDSIIDISQISFSSFRFSLLGVNYSVNMFLVVLVSFWVGVISGSYGMGGGTLNTAMLVAIFGLPIYATAGATMLCTFVSSLTGVISFTIFSKLSEISTQQPISPDWLLGSLLGIGGILGTYFGAYIQKFITPKSLRRILAVLIWMISIRYIASYLSNIFN